MKFINEVHQMNNFVLFALKNNQSIIRKRTQNKQKAIDKMDIICYIITKVWA